MIQSDTLYKIVDSLSDGYVVCNLDTKETTLAKIRKSVVYKKGNILIGDIVKLDDQNNINDVVERKNFLLRPRIANVDSVLILMSVKEPNYSTYLIDKFLLTVNVSNVEPVVVFTKIDLLTCDEEQNFKKQVEYYESIGYKVFLTSNKNEHSKEKLISYIKNKTISVMGQTGVGKSSLLNTFSNDLNFAEGSYDMKNLNRGKHITKKVIFCKFFDGFIADTPGFSSFELEFDKQTIATNFPGFHKYLPYCKFSDCLHLTCDMKICKIKDEFSKDEIYKLHYENYLKILSEVKENKKWR